MKTRPETNAPQGDPQRPLRIALFYGHVASNIGDLAINVGTLQMIAQGCPDAVVDIVMLDAAKSQHLAFSASSFDSDLPVHLHHLTSDPVRGFEYLADPALFLRDCGLETAPDVILLAAGEHLFDYGNGENAKSLFWRVLPAYVGAALGLRVVQMPATFGPFETQASRDLIGAFLGACTAWSTRDAASRAYLAGLYDQMEPALQLDPAFMIDRAPKAMDARPKSTPTTALAMRSDGWGIRLDSEKRKGMTAAFRADGHASSRAYQITKTILSDLLSQKRGDVVIFVQTIADKLLAAALMEHAETLGAKTLGAAARVRVVTPGSVGDYLTLLAQADRVITSRFHAVILALVMGTPAFGLYFTDHGHKMPGLFDLLGLPEFCTNGTEGDTGDLARRMLVPGAQGRAKTKGALTRLDSLRGQGMRWFGAALKAPAPAPSQQVVLRGRLAELALLLADGSAPDAAPQDGTPLDAAGAAALVAGLLRARVVLFAQDGPAVDLAASLPGKLIFVIEPDLARMRARRRAFMGRIQSSGAQTSGVVMHPDAATLWAAPWFRLPDLVVMQKGAAVQGLTVALHSGARPDLLAGPGAMAALAPLLARYAPHVSAHLDPTGSLTAVTFAKPPLALAL